MTDPRAVTAPSTDLTYEQLREAVAFIFSRRFGLSSEGLVREALGVPQRDDYFNAVPRDEGDSARSERTFSDAPVWMQRRMASRMEWYREIARLGWPHELPARGGAR